MKTEPMHSSYGIPRGTIPFTPGKAHVVEHTWYVPEVRCGDDVMTFAKQLSEENARAVAEYEINVTRQTTVEKRDKSGRVWYPSSKRDEFMKIQRTANPEISIRVTKAYTAMVVIPGYGLVSDPSPNTLQEAQQLVEENMKTENRR